ncbi:MAG: ABC transporter substrate-binding protein [Chitinophagales bacterium]
MFRNQIHFSTSLLLCICLLIGACGSGAKQSQGTQTNTETSNEMPDFTPEVVKPPTRVKTNSESATNNTGVVITIPDKNSELEEIPEVEARPYTANVAVMLPFQLNKFAPTASNMDSVPKKTKLSLQFYEGIQIGLEHLKNEGVSLNVQVYDTQNSPFEVKKILDNPEMKQADLILGPIYNKQLVEVAKFAKANRIHAVSPLSPSNKITYDNPYYLMASPSIETQCAAMFDYIVGTYPNRNIVALSTSKPNESNLAALFYRFATVNAANREKYGYVDVTQVVSSLDDSEAKIEAHLSPDKENVIVVTSFNELFINDLLRKLNMLKDRYPITVFGMPNWMKMNTLQLDYLANLNFHIPAPFWANSNSEDYRKFKEDYFNVFKTHPSSRANTGYDLITYFARNFHKHGNKIEQSFGNNEVQGMFNNFDFKGASKHQYNQSFFTTDYLENKYVNILKYNSLLELEKVN